MTQTVPEDETAALAADIGSTFLFEGLDSERLTWLAERGDVVVVPAGDRLYREGDVAACFFVLLSGRLRMTRQGRSGDVVLNETDHRGSYLGAVRAYVSGSETSTADDRGGSEHYANTITAVTDLRLFRLPAPVFAEAVRTWFPMAVHLLDGVFLGVRSVERRTARDEQLAAVGRLSATLAHELNNPAAAGQRAAGQLREKVGGMRHTLAMLADGGLDPALLPRLVRWQEEAADSAAEVRPRSPLEVSDAEDEVADWLEGAGVPDAYQLAGSLVAADLDSAWLTGVQEAVGGACLEPAVRWISYTVDTQLLLNEVEEAARRVSDLVASVKTWTQMDQAPFGDVDVVQGLEATLALLRGKADARLELDVPAALPPVPGYGGELNQVWTNLIDNALAAVPRGGLVRVTAREEGDAVVVAVTDDGPGVPEEVRDRMFEQFVTTRRDSGGTGLGLHLVRQVVDRHDGEVSVETGSGGTTMSVRLPRGAARPPEDTDLEREALAEAETGARA